MSSFFFLKINLITKLTNYKIIILIIVGHDRQINLLKDGNYIKKMHFSLNIN